MMRKFKQLLRSLTQQPLGYRGDRPQGLGLALAMAEAKKNPTAGVENYLRGQAGTRHGQGQEVASS
ncbi:MULTISPECIES: hypothetical protein [unclassified Crossiella]|uniref:hypothetical protein n=1 Tax=unclassified Crossiella TaxID=2620835 RepID=UPI001FFE350A|nr:MULTISPECIES: hypothetical protein [unclassified Crossiella]MCK2242704.1 hypothetical protein [Crossiella sp. S99.2]MCK2256581.1 hypothetical protein [Crossiella sp. S99.1]